MHVMPTGFSMLTFAGVWQPINWKSKLKIIPYKILTFITLFLMMTMCILQGLTLHFMDLQLSEWTELFYSVFTIFLDTGRSFNYVFNRENIIDLANMLKKNCCLAKNVDEMQVQNQVDRFIRKVTIILNIGVLISISAFLLTPLILHKGEHVLPDLIWLPYDLKPNFNFWLTYACEVITYRALSILNATDCCIVSGFMLQVCAQFDIMSLRLKEMIQSIKLAQKNSDSDSPTQLLFERQIIEETIRHHLYILRFAKQITETFIWTLVTQFIVVSMIITFIAYNLRTTKPGSFAFFSAIIYLMSMTAGFFYVCWCGNQVTLKGLNFSDNAYKTEWIFLSQESRKKLLFIIHQSSKPLMMSCGHFVVLNLATFKSIIKFSYTVLNFLREVS